MGLYYSTPEEDGEDRWKRIEERIRLLEEDRRDDRKLSKEKAMAERVEKTYEVVEESRTISAAPMWKELREKLALRRQRIEMEATL